MSTKKNSALWLTYLCTLAQHRLVQRSRGVFNTDGDGAGDACDICPENAEDDPEGDMICGYPPDPCPCDADWKNHGEYVTCVVKSTKDAVRAGDLTDAERAPPRSLRPRRAAAARSSRYAAIRPLTVSSA